MKEYKTTYRIIEADNGILFKDTPEDNVDYTMDVAKTGEEFEVLGHYLWGDIRAVMDSDLSSDIEVSIHIKSVKPIKF